MKLSRGVVGLGTAALLAAALCPPAFAAQPWHLSLSYHGGGVWQLRVAVDITNNSGVDIAGAPVPVRVGAGRGEARFMGARAESIRVVDERGVELLYDVVSPDGRSKREGTLQAGDTIYVPAVVGAGKTARVWIYAKNPQAWQPPDYIRARLINPDFEAGSAGDPEGWRRLAEDSSHRLFWQKGGAHSGNWCVRAEADPGAKPSWFKFAQTRIMAVPGQRVKITAWVKAKNVQGKAGWYIHVNGQQKSQIVNIVKSAGSGTFDWRPLTIEFTVPEDGQWWDLGTVLWGTGTAWYDDVRVQIEYPGNLQVKVGPTETLPARPMGEGRPPWPRDRSFAWAAPVRVVNDSDAPINGLINVRIKRFENALGKLLGWGKPARLVAVDPARPGQLVPVYSFDGEAIFRGSLSPRQMKYFWLFAAPARKETPPLALAELAKSPINLLPNGTMEDGVGERPAGWSAGEEGRPGSRRFTAKRVRGGLEGDWCLELSVPEKVGDIGWVGWRQKVPVKPNCYYLIGGFLKTRGVRPGARIHIHLLKADGSLSDYAPFRATNPEVRGTTDWTWTCLAFRTPPDCHFVEVHLTMRATGTLWHDAVILCEGSLGTMGELVWRASPRQHLRVWKVNPLVKVFRDDPPGPEVRRAELWAARNEYEPLQLAVWSAAGGELRVSASSLTGPGGARIDPPQAYRVGMVPVDYPTNYYSSKQPIWERLLPSWGPSCDGWAGWWPDPLVPIRGPVKLQAGRTQPLWFTYHIPASAPPGDYRGRITLQLGAARREIPVRLHVWRFTHPQLKHVGAIYDLRQGHIPAGLQDRQSLERWYRFLARYNISPGLVRPRADIKWDSQRREPILNFEGFDWACRILIDELKVRYLYGPMQLYLMGWAWPPRRFFGLEPFSPEWIEAYQKSLRAFYDHLRQRGWADHFVYYISDEPDRRNPEVHRNLARACDLARQAVPGLKVYSSTWTHIKALDGHLNLWGIGPHGSFPLDEMEQRRRAGDHFWFTTDGHMCIDTPFCAIERLLPWLCYKYRVEAYEFWGVSWWTYNPWKYGWHSFIRQSHEGKVYRWVRYPNGDGFLTYPGWLIGEEGPLPSIRLEAARDGIDDYEMFYALAKLARQRGDSKTLAALERALSLVSMPNRGGRFSTLLMPDPEAFAQARLAVGEQLNRLLAGR